MATVVVTPATGAVVADPVGVAGDPAPTTTVVASVPVATVVAAVPVATVVVTAVGQSRSRVEGAARRLLPAAQRQLERGEFDLGCRHARDREADERRHDDTDHREGTPARHLMAIA